MVLYVAGVGYLLGVLTAPFVAIGWRWMNGVRILVSFAWFVRAAGSFFGRSLWPTLWRSMVLAVLNILVSTVFFLVIALFWVSVVQP